MGSRHGIDSSEYYSVKSVQAPTISSLLERSFSTDVLILDEDELGEAYFRLSEGLLGELFQKFTNYNQNLALIVSDFDAYGKRVSELIYEHRSNTAIRFFNSSEQAQQWALQVTNHQVGRTHD